MQTHEIRERFIQHFVKAGHTLAPSASLVVDDPNLLFVNAGMVPFKPYFLGQQTPPFENGTATSIQKCVRTLDIDEVGVTTRHNTFFQMAGNFSFGQYFKEGAITHAWTLLTDPLDQGGYGFDPERLWVTVYLDDDEAADIWHKKIGIPLERIQRLGMKDNYWSMGVPGPCGPCSEIYYDRGPAYGKEGGPVVDDNRYMEIWNLVFMEKERGAGFGKEEFEIVGDLPKKNIDTGMGVERVACILQGVENVYETDLLRPVIDEAQRLSGSTYEDGNPENDRRFRVIADHARTAMMIIVDGVTPSNEGRGYILRRLMRRIIRSATMLGVQGRCMESFMNIIMDTMTPSYPEIAENRERVIRTAVNEESAFLKTLEAGTARFDNTLETLRQQGSSLIDGARAFELHDTYGFPIELTIEMAAEHGLTVDQERFTQLMEEQRERAKADSRAKKHGHTDLSVYREWVDNHPTRFTGYEELESEATVLGLLSENRKIQEATEGQEVEVILDSTPLYGESGGQLGDRGQIIVGDSLLDVTDVQKVAKKVWVHKARVVRGGVALGDEVLARVDNTWRHGARQAHSATHLIHAALRQVLGNTAVQAGSMNKPGYLRFDFSYGAALTEEQLRDIQLIANEAVDADWTVNTIETSLEEAKAMGAMALFTENYGDRVRVVEMGGPFSMELCGGTHVAHSSQIGPVSVLGESSVGSGVRRIEAYSGLDSFHRLSTESALVNGLASSLKARPEELPERVAQLTEKLKEAEKRLEQMHLQRVESQAAALLNQVEQHGTVAFLGAQLPQGTTMKDLRPVASDLLGKLGTQPAVVVLGADDNQGKAPLVAAVNSAAVSIGLNAGDLVRVAMTVLGGKGGGKPSLAQGSGSRPGEFHAAFAALRAELDARN